MGGQQAKMKKPEVAVEDVCSNLNKLSLNEKNATQVPVDQSTQVPANELGQVPANDSAQVPANDSAQVPANDSAQVPANDSAQVPVNDSAQVPANDSAPVPENDSAQDPANELAQDPANELAQVPANESARVQSEGAAQAHDSTPVPANEMAQVPANNSDQVPVIDSTFQAPANDSKPVASDDPVPENTQEPVATTEVSEIDVTGESEISAENEEGASEEEDESDSSDSPPPETVPVVATDENVIATYSQTKVYRFDSVSHEWKERGFGKILILESDEKECRVVMWMQGTGKIICNFRLFPGLKIANVQSKPKTATWTCFNYSETDTPVKEILACKFATESECVDFMDKFTTYSNAAKPPTEKSEEAVGDDTDKSCAGCIGCEPEEFEFPQVHVTAKVEAVIDSQLEPDSCADNPESVEPAMFN